MSTMYDDVEAICPYFVRSDKRKIVCEGMKDYSLGLEFDRARERDIYREKYCNTYDYTKCDICVLLNKKYE